jgi:hypothetical protein
MKNPKLGTSDELYFSGDVQQLAFRIVLLQFGQVSELPFWSCGPNIKLMFVINRLYENVKMPCPSHDNSRPQEILF